MSELLQEYVASASQPLRVDRAAGVIRGVKLLGLVSRNGRCYREHALVEAIGLYEGAKVNINHPKGHPLAPRDYQDRLGIVRGVTFRAGEGLFGDLHFNPKHALSEQLVWDAEHAPQNVGLSHNVLARTSRSGDQTVVEAILKVQSIDLVADPATTGGLFEHATGDELKQNNKERECQNATSSLHSSPWPLDGLTAEQLRRERPDLVDQIVEAHNEQLRQLQARLDELLAQHEAARRRECIGQLLREHDLPLPAHDGAAYSPLVSQQFIETLMRAADEETVRRLVEERAALVRSAVRYGNSWRHAGHRRPRSRDQFETAFLAGTTPPRSAAEFAAALRGR